MHRRHHGDETRKATTGADKPQGDGLRGILRQKDYLKATALSGNAQPLVSSTPHTVLPTRMGARPLQSARRGLTSHHATSRRPLSSGPRLRRRRSVDKW
jgi:hypothetical protein